MLASTNVLRAPGHYSEYRGLKARRHRPSRGYRGPVVIVWTGTRMFQPDQNSFLHLDGTMVGGDAILIYSISIKLDLYRVHDSWGQGSGVVAPPSSVAETWNSYSSEWCGVSSAAGSPQED